MEAITTINKIIPKQIHKNPNLSTIIEYLRGLAFDSKTVAIWTGLWSKKLYNTLNTKLQKFPYKGKYKTSEVLKLTKIYTDAAKQLYVTRQAVIKDPDITVSKAHTDTVATKITAFFEADTKKKASKKDKDKPKSNDGANLGKNQTLCIPPLHSTTTNTSKATVQPTPKPPSNNSNNNQHIIPEHIVDSITENYSITPHYLKRPSPLIPSPVILSPRKLKPAIQRLDKRKCSPPQSQMATIEQDDWDFLPPLPPSPLSRSPSPSVFPGRSKRCKLRRIDSNDDLLQDSQPNSHISQFFRSLSCDTDNIPRPLVIVNTLTAVSPSVTPHSTIITDTAPATDDLPLAVPWNREGVG
jgi:hypothetical protein